MNANLLESAHSPSLAGSGSLASAFLAVCEQHGSRTALTSEGGNLTYSELRSAASRAAGHLAALRLPPASLVAVCLPRSAEYVIAVLGIILAGHAYLPLDEAYPAARLQQTLEDSRAAALIAVSGRDVAFNGPRLDLDQLLAPVPTPPAPDTQPDALAYVIYTSGSTGRPKGVMVSHGNVLGLLTGTQPLFSFGPDDVWTLFHSFAFDFSVWEMWGPLLTGGRLVLVPFPTSRSPVLFRELLSRERVTVLNQTPTAFRLLEEAGRASTSPLSLRYVLFGGEALVLRSLLPWIERHGDEHPRLVNLYGITETTVHVTYRRILRLDAERETDSLIGEPIPGLQLRLLDAGLQPVPAGTPGEIHVSGSGVALGYLHDEDLTASRFLRNPFAAGPATRLYRSGDLALRRADGELVYLGRADRQVKVHGFRIELAEVESALSRCPGVRQLAATVYTAPGEPAALAVVYTSSPPVERETLLRFAEEALPAHMRPAFVYPVETLPLNLNGKLDLQTLSPASPARLPEGSLEDTLLHHWQQILGQPDVNADDSFFDCGGSSLLLMMLRARLQTLLGHEVPITTLFRFPTVRSLAEHLQAAGPAVSRAQPRPVPAQDARKAWLAAQAQRRQAR